MLARVAGTAGTETQLRLSLADVALAPPGHAVSDILTHSPPPPQLQLQLPAYIYDNTHVHPCAACVHQCTAFVPVCGAVTSKLDTGVVLFVDQLVVYLPSGVCVGGGGGRLGRGKGGGYDTPVQG